MRDQRFLAGTERDGGVAHVRRRLPERAPAVRQFLEQQRLVARLVQQRPHLGERIDGLVDADQFARGLELGNPRTHVLRLRVGT